MPLFVLQYCFGPDRERRLAVRPRHRAYLEKLVEEGIVLAAGPFADDSGALIVYAVESEESLERLLQEDPYVQEDVFGTRTIQEWAPFIAMPLEEQS